MLRLFGPAGIYIYMAIAIVGANIQVLKPVQFSVYSHPIALGTILFTSTFLCTDILAEFYSPKTARKAIFLGFAAMLLMTIFMTLNLGFRPLPPDHFPNSIRWLLRAFSLPFSSPMNSRGAVRNCQLIPSWSAWWTSSFRAGISSRERR